MCESVKEEEADTVWLAGIHLTFMVLHKITNMLMNFSVHFCNFTSHHIGSIAFLIKWKIKCNKITHRHSFSKSYSSKSDWVNISRYYPPTGELTS